MKENLLNYDRKIHSNYIASEEELYKKVIAEEFGIDVNLHIVPRFGLNHNPLSEVFPESLPQGLAYNDTIYIFPAFSSVLGLAINRNYTAISGLVDQLDDYLQKAVIDELVKGTFVEEFIESVQIFTDRYKRYGDIFDAKCIADSFNFLHSHVDGYSRFYEIAILPLVSGSEVLRENFRNVIEPILAHESAHIWVSQYTKSYKLSSNEMDIVNSILLNQDNLFFPHEMCMDSTNENQSLDLALRRNGISFVKKIAKLIPDKDLQAKTIFTHIWAGVEEDLARAVSYWKTHHEDQWYNEETLLSYFDNTCKIIWKGNLGIEELLDLLEDGGLNALEVFVLEQIENTFFEVKEILG